MIIFLKIRSHYVQNYKIVYNEIHMPAKSPKITVMLEKLLREIGAKLRARRELLGISAVATAEAAGMSRITLHRIERGEPSVAMGAYASVIFALGLSIELQEPKRAKQKRVTNVLPEKIRPGDFKQLKRLAWQLKSTQKITPQEALDLYERNWRHVDVKKMEAKERQFLEALLAAFGRERLLV